jgi:GNAT superfamily N-acetyltransferase
MMIYHIATPADPGPPERAAVSSHLAAHNAEIAATQSSTVAILICSEQQIVGGLWGVCAYDWLAIELLFVPEQLRGRAIGRDLVAKAEEAALSRGCIGAWLDTFSFQARGFYEKLGYVLAGQIDDHPLGGARYFLKKRFGR